MLSQNSIFTYLSEAPPDRFCIILNKELNIGSYHTHGHDYLEMELILSGKGRIWINNCCMELASGLMYLLSPYDYHRLEIDETGNVISIHFLPSSIKDIGFPELKTAYVKNMSQANTEYYAEKLIKLAKENEEGCLYCEQELWAFAVQMMIDLLRDGDIYSLSQPDRRLQSALKYIQDHYTDSSICLNDAAKACYLSPNYFCSVFKNTVGCHFAEYVQECRLQHACVLIKTTQNSITEIAYDSGFSNLSNFFRCFKKAFNCTPSEYRKTID